MSLNLFRLNKRLENMEDKLINLDKKTTGLFFLFKERYYILESKKKLNKKY